MCTDRESRPLERLPAAASLVPTDIENSGSDRVAAAGHWFLKLVQLVEFGRFVLQQVTRLRSARELLMLFRLRLNLLDTDKLAFSSFGKWWPLNFELCF